MVDGTRNSIYEVNVVPAPVSNLCLISVCEWYDKQWRIFFLCDDCVIEMNDV
jgi:hypothetical protein